MEDENKSQQDKEFDQALEEFFAALKALSPEQADAIADALAQDKSDDND